MCALHFHKESIPTWEKKRWPKAASSSGKCGNSFSFCADGLVLNSGERSVVGADVRGDPRHGLRRERAAAGRVRVALVPCDIVAVSSNNAVMLPLYRQCVHPRIRQMAVVGYAEIRTSIYPYGMMA
ncbi:hypothetical protein EJB05_45304, partial [Eragrostis curvula]